MNSSCVICSKKLEYVRGQNTFATRCGHLYHQICITKHVIEHSNCPYCKKDCTLKQLVKLRWRQVDDDDEFKFKAAHTITSSQLMESFTELNNAIKKSDLQVEQLQDHSKYLIEELASIGSLGTYLKSENDKLKDAWKQSENEREETTRNILIKNLRKQVKIKRNMVKEAQEDAKIARETIAEFDDMNLYADVPDVVPENRNQCSSRSIFQTYKINN